MSDLDERLHDLLGGSMMEELRAEGANELIARLRNRAAAARAEGNATALGDALAFEGAAREIEGLGSFLRAWQSRTAKAEAENQQLRAEVARLAAENERLRAAITPRPIEEAPKDREVIGVERPPFEDSCNYFHMGRWNEEHQQFMADAGYDRDTGAQRWAFCGVTHYIDPQSVPLLPEHIFEDGDIAIEDETRTALQDNSDESGEGKRLDDSPDWEDLRGRAPDATGDLSSEAFIRKLRDAW